MFGFELNDLIPIIVVAVIGELISILSRVTSGRGGVLHKILHALARVIPTLSDLGK